MSTISMSEEITKSYGGIIESSPLLSAQEEIKFADSIINGKRNKQQAKHALLKANIRLVIKLAHRKKSSNVPVNDLISGGILGLAHAIERFNPEKHHARLSTYAYSWIKLYINNTILEYNSGIHVPQNVLLKKKKYKELKEENPSVTHKELMEKLKVTKKGLKKIEGCNSSIISLNTPVGGEQEELILGDTIADEKAILADKEAVKNDQIDLMQEALGELDEIPRAIIIARHLSGEKGTLVSIGEKYGMSKQRVEQIEKKALASMKKKISRMTSLGY